MGLAIRLSLPVILKSVMISSYQTALRAVLRQAQHPFEPPSHRLSIVAVHTLFLFVSANYKAFDSTSLNLCPPAGLPGPLYPTLGSYPTSYSATVLYFEIEKYEQPSRVEPVLQLQGKNRV